MRKRLLKRAFSTLLAFVMLLSLLPASALAGDEPATFTKITSTNDFTTGKYVMVVETGYAAGVYNSGWVLPEAIAAAAQQQHDDDDPPETGAVIAGVKAHTIHLTCDSALSYAGGREWEPDPAKEEGKPRNSPCSVKFSAREGSFFPPGTGG